MEKGKGLTLTPLMIALGYSIGCGTSNLITAIRDWRGGLKNFDAILVFIACAFAISTISIAFIEAKGGKKMPSAKKAFYAFGAIISSCISIILCICFCTGRVIGDVHEIPTVFAMLGFILVAIVYIYLLLDLKKNKDPKAKP